MLVFLRSPHISIYFRPHCSTVSMYVGAAYCWSSMVCLSVCLSVTIMNLAKTAEPIEIPFGIRTQVSSRKHRTLAPPGECDWTVRVWPRCDLMSDYFDQLFKLWKSFTPQNERIITSLTVIIYWLTYWFSVTCGLNCDLSADLACCSVSERPLQFSCRGVVWNCSGRALPSY